MTKSAVISARVDAETLALVDQVTKAHGRSRAWFAAQAIRKAAEKEAEFLAFVQVGIGAADRGDVVSHEEVTAEVQEMIAKHKARCDV
jgi:predicted transcriptional regulator